MPHVLDRTALAAIVVALQVSAGTKAATLNVPADYPTIQACIDAAVSDVDECVVAPGTYHETINFLDKAISVRSAGGAPVTTIDATGIGGSVVTFTAAESSKAVFDGFTITSGTGTDLLGNGELYGGGMLIFDSDPTVKDCTFENNSASHYGGGMAMFASNAVVINCVFTQNAADFGGGIATFFGRPTVTRCSFSGSATIEGGGGIFNYQGRVTATGCTFAGNTGGGFSNEHGSVALGNCTFNDNLGGGVYNLEGNMTVTGCGFTRNRGGNGGGIRNFIGSLVVSDSTFIGNRGFDGGAIWNEGHATVVRCTFDDNSASGVGGGIRIIDGGFGPKAIARVTDCWFTRNMADSGGGLYNENTSPILTRCTFIGNSATIDGGGMYNELSDAVVADCAFSRNTAGAFGGGMRNKSGNPTVANCTFSGQKAAYGGGMANWPSHASVTNCTFSGNRGEQGGGIYNVESSPVLTNCTFSGNSASTLGGAMQNFGGAPTMSNCIFHGDSLGELTNPFSDPIVRFSNVDGGLPPRTVDGGGNVDLDPKFVRNPSDGGDGWGDDPATPGVDEGANDDYGDLRLQPGSPCINAGDPAFMPPPGETDLDGHARVLCARADMGAYEFGIGDHDCNQIVNLLDFRAWASCMTGPQGGPYEPGCEAFDFDGDDDVDLHDAWQFELAPP